MTDPSLYRDDSRVRHMIAAIERVLDVGKGMSRDELVAAEQKTESMLFNLTIIGEAANNISKEFAAKNPEVEWKGIAGVRHKIVHDYADIDYDVIWRIIQEDIPRAYAQLKEVAKTLPPEPTEPPENMKDFL